MAEATNKVVKKRRRGANYTFKEKLMLLGLITEYKDVLEDKGISNMSFHKKRAVWNSITDTYNSKATSGQRSVKQLKVLYENMKQKRRNEEETRESDNNQDNYAIDDACNQDALTPQQLDNTSQMEDDVDNHALEADDFCTNNSVIANIDLTEEQESDSPSSENSTANNNYVEETRAEVELKDKNYVENAGSDQRTKEQETERKHLAEKNASKLQQNRIIFRAYNLGNMKKIYLKTKFQNALLERKMLLQAISHKKQEFGLKMQILKKNLEKYSNNN